MVLGCPRIAGCALSMNGWEGRWHPTPAPPLTRSSLPGSSDATRPGSENPLGPPESHVTRGPRKEGTSQTKGETTPAARWVSSKARPCHSPERDAASTVSAPWGQHGCGPRPLQRSQPCWCWVWPSVCKKCNICETRAGEVSLYQPGGPQRDERCP